MALNRVFKRVAWALSACCMLPAAMAHSQVFSTYQQYVEPPYSSLVIGYAQARFDDYDDNASDVNFRFEQRLLENIYLSASYLDFSQNLSGFAFPLELEDLQLGVGYMERSELGPHADLSLLVGRETFQRPLSDDTNAAFIDESNYFGVQFGLREAHGPIEAQAAIAYVFHDGQRDDQLRWHVGAFLTVWETLAVGLRYQDNDDYSVASVEFRFSW